jgi:hypothetical protein
MESVVATEPMDMELQVGVEVVVECYIFIMAVL